VSKIAQCVFYYDGQKGKYAYIYASPYEYSFWADDSMVCGVQRGKKIGYVMRASADSLGYRSLLGSINVCSPLVQFGRTDTLRVSLKASIDDFLYFEFPAGLNREVVKIDRNRGAITLRETFDSAGAVRRQTIFEYDTTKSKNTWFPRKMIVRGNSAGAIETDTLIFTKVEIDKGIKESVFVIPAFTDIGRGK
jgi:hypothetical protein